MVQAKDKEKDEERTSPSLEETTVRLVELAKNDLKLHLDTINDHIDNAKEKLLDSIVTPEPSKEQRDEYVILASGDKGRIDENGNITVDYQGKKVIVEPACESHLTESSGVFYLGDQKETYYNLDMSVVVRVANESGIPGDFWEREDGCKMLGNFIMVAANYSVHPYGSLVKTSLGTGVVVDTGGFADYNSSQIDIAVNW